MTGTSISLRRWSGCNLHWYSPLLPKDRNRHLYEPPPRYNRYKLYTLPEYYQPTQDSRYKRDKHGTYVWMGTDCGWEFLATRPGIVRIRPLSELFERLHDHVHSRHKENRLNVPKELQARLVSGLETLDGLLDKIPAVEVEVTQREAGWFNFVTRIARRGDWGCRLGLADLSARLDERWGTGVWKVPKKFRISFLTDQLTPELYARVQDEFLPAVEIDTTESRTRITWMEQGVTAQDALREAREALIATGLYPELGNFTFPREVSE